MRVGPGRVHNVPDGNAAHRQGIGNERPVAPPRDRFRAHRRRVPPFGQAQQFHQILLEFGGLHVVCVTAEVEIPPAGVNGIPERVAQATQAGHVDVLDPRQGQRFRNGFLIELRVVSRPRNGSNIHQQIHSVRPQHCQKLFHGTVGVADGRHAMHFSLTFNMA